ncbi:MAG: PepSY domain-containing protein [Bacteroidota bacterium]
MSKIINIWRYSHFALAISSSIFVLLTTVTGIFLAFEPVEKELQPFKVAGADQLCLGEVIDTLKSKYDEILTLEINANQFVAVDVFSMEEDLSGKFYINPFSGEKIGDIPEKRPIYEFMTVLHRSLFLKSIGRIFVGVTAFLLFLIALTGFILFVRRQRGIRHVFDKLVKESFVQHFHVVLGRWMLLPILVITLTGVYLSLLQFELIPAIELEPEQLTSELATSPELTISEFEIFRNTKLYDVRSMEFPFTTDVEDFFLLNLKDRELKINQKTGQIVESLQYPFVDRLSTLSFNLHTGTGSLLWSLVLAIAGVNILFFMYSGFAISYKRITSKVKNKFSPNEAEYIILVGSENGSTRQFGKILQEALLKLNQKVFIDELNNFKAYEKMKDLVVMTSTYGIGEPPANANQFLPRLETTPVKQNTSYSVVGFGSLSYPDFCQYALDVDTALAQQATFQQIDEPFLIHNKSYTSFKTWAEKWGKSKDLRLDLPAELSQKKRKLHSFKVLEKRVVDDGYSETFTLLLKPSSQQFQSGDLLGIAPPDDPVERQYSVAKVGKSEILLSVKRHEKGLCSNYLYELSVGAELEGSIQKNKDFHLVKGAKNILLIGNGTGIAPYLGMIQNPSRAKLQLYWGGRTRQSFELYKDRIEEAIQSGQLASYQIAYSRENNESKYVQDLLKEEGESLVYQLQNGAYIYLCGSITMQNGVLALLEELCQQHLQKPLSFYQNKGQILMDCY